MRVDKHFHVNGSAVIDSIFNQNHSIGSAAISEVVQPLLPCVCVWSGPNRLAAAALWMDLSK